MGFTLARPCENRGPLHYWPPCGDQPQRQPSNCWACSSTSIGDGAERASLRRSLFASVPRHRTMVSPGRSSRPTTVRSQRWNEHRSHRVPADALRSPMMAPSPGYLDDIVEVALHGRRSHGRGVPRRHQRSSGTGSDKLFSLAVGREEALTAGKMVCRPWHHGVGSNIMLLSSNFQNYNYPVAFYYIAVLRYVLLYL